LVNPKEYSKHTCAVPVTLTVEMVLAGETKNDLGAPATIGMEPTPPVTVVSSVGITAARPNAYQMAASAEMMTLVAPVGTVSVSAAVTVLLVT
jgi:hypothetical protein